MPVDLEPVPVGVEWRPEIGRQRLNLAERDAADLRLRRDVVDERRDLVAVGYQPPHQLERAVVFFDTAPQILDTAVREAPFCSLVVRLQTVALRQHLLDVRALPP